MSYDLVRSILFLFTDTTTDNASSVDGLLVVAIIFIWIISIVLFYRKWENIRAMKPTDGIYRQLPKNLETIRVVKQQKDSVILNVSERKASFHLKQNSKLQRSFTDPSFPLAIMEV